MAPATPPRIAAEVDGQRQYIQFLGGGVVGVAAEDGRFLWRYDAPANRTANCSTPIFTGQPRLRRLRLQHRRRLVKLAQRRTAASRRPRSTSRREMRNHHGGMVLVDGYLYGFDSSNLTCLDFKTGQVKWSDRSVGKGSLAYADGHLYARSERGPVALVEATPTGYVEKGRFDQPDRSGKTPGPTRSSPAAASTCATRTSCSATT